MSRTSAPHLSTPPSSSRSWFAVVSIALGAFIVVTSEFLPIGLLTSVAGGLRVSAGTAGLMITVPGLVAALAAPMMTILAGRMDRRELVVALIALLGVANLTAAFAPNFAVMLLARVIFGVSLGGFWTIAVTLGGRLVPASSMARATTLILAGISIATVVGVPAGTVIASISGWRFAFGAVGGVALLVGVAQLFVLPSLPAPQATGFRQLTDLLRHADARLGLLTIAFVIAGHFAAYTYVTPFLLENGTSPRALSGLLLVYGGAGIVGNFVGGAMAARHLRSTLNSVIVLLALSILLLPFVGHQPSLVAALIFIWGFAFGALPIALQLWVFKAAPEALEGGAAMLVSTFQIFIALGSVVGGRVVDGFGTSVVLWGGGATALLALGIVALSRSGPKSNAPQPQAHLI